MRRVAKAWWEGLRRTTSSDRFIPQVDGLRFVAITSVMLYHLNQFVSIKGGYHPREMCWGWVLDRGNLGVQLFFAISGFIIALPFAIRARGNKRAPRLSRYYLRRVRRLEPPYLINLLLLFIALIGVKGMAAGELFPHLLASMFYVHTPVYGEFSAINGVAWSLEIELQFYLIAPLLALIFRLPSKEVRRLLLGIAVLLAAWVSGTPMVHADYAWTLLGHAQFFLCGFVLAECYSSGCLKVSEDQWLWNVLGLFAWPLVWWAFEGGFAGRLLMPVGVLIAYACAFKGIWWRKLFSWAPLYLIGGMCYTLYLYHFQIISLVGNPTLRVLEWLDWQDPRLHFGLVVLVTLPAVLLLGSLLYLAFEKPFMNRPVKGSHAS